MINTKQSEPYLRPQVEEVVSFPFSSYLQNNSESGSSGGGNGGTEPIIDDGTSHPWH